jgi:hypothetical protein
MCRRTLYGACKMLRKVILRIPFTGPNMTYSLIQEIHIFMKCFYCSSYRISQLKGNVKEKRENCKKKQHKIRRVFTFTRQVYLPEIQKTGGIKEIWCLNWDGGEGDDGGGVGWGDEGGVGGGGRGVYAFRPQAAFKSHTSPQIPEIQYAMRHIPTLLQKIHFLEPVNKNTVHYMYIGILVNIHFLRLKFEVWRLCFFVNEFTKDFKLCTIKIKFFFDKNKFSARLSFSFFFSSFP